MSLWDDLSSGIGDIGSAVGNLFSGGGDNPSASDYENLGSDGGSDYSGLFDTSGSGDWTTAPSGFGSQASALLNALSGDSANAASGAASSAPSADDYENMGSQSAPSAISDALHAASSGSNSSNSQNSGLFAPLQNVLGSILGKTPKSAMQSLETIGLLSSLFAHSSALSPSRMRSSVASNANTNWTPNQQTAFNNYFNAAPKVFNPTGHKAGGSVGSGALGCLGKYALGGPVAGPVGMSPMTSATAQPPAQMTGAQMPQSGALGTLAPQQPMAQPPMAQSGAMGAPATGPNMPMQGLRQRFGGGIPGRMGPMPAMGTTGGMPGGMAARYAMGGQIPPQGMPQAQGGTPFSGYVQGDQPGQSDLVPIQVSPGEYVMDADTVASLGDGNNQAGAAVLDRMRMKLRAAKRSAPPSQIPPPMSQLSQGPQ